MPLYTVTTQAGVLSGDAKATLAGERPRFTRNMLAFRRTGSTSFFTNIPRETASRQGMLQRQRRSRSLSALAGHRNTSVSY
jgi:hypothetical protein